VHAPQRVHGICCSYLFTLGDTLTASQTQERIYEASHCFEETKGIKDGNREEKAKPKEQKKIR